MTNTSDDPVLAAGVFLELAKKMLRRDGHVSPAAFLFLPDRRVGLIELRHRDRQERMLTMVTLAEEAVRTDAHAVAIVSEVWTATMDLARVTQADFRRAVSRRRDRGEALTCIVLTREGHSRVYGVPFTRRGTTIRFGRLDVTDDDIPNVLAPLARAWELVPTMASEEWQRRFAMFPRGRATARRRASRGP